MATHAGGGCYDLSGEWPQKKAEFLDGIARIWPERPGGPWIYVEQAPAEKPAEPQRQQVLQIGRRTDGAYESRVFLLPGSPLRFAGAWKDPARLAGLG